MTNGPNPNILYPSTPLNEPAAKSRRRRYQGRRFLCAFEEMNVPPEVKADLTKRLKRLEGQVRGVQKMLDEERDCREILQQLAAIRSAAHQARILVIRKHAAACLLRTGDLSSSQEVLDELVSVLERI